MQQDINRIAISVEHHGNILIRRRKSSNTYLENLKLAIFSQLRFRLLMLMEVQAMLMSQFFRLSLPLVFPIIIAAAEFIIYTLQFAINSIIVSLYDES